MTAPLTLADLTRRQRQVLSYVARGMTNVAIARVLQIRPDSVASHLSITLNRVVPDAEGEARRHEGILWFRDQADRSKYRPEEEVRKHLLPKPRNRLSLALECRKHLEDTAIAACEGPADDSLRKCAAEWAMIAFALRFFPNPKE